MTDKYTHTIGLTGGIGSGKTTVAKFFEEFGVAVYYADDASKKLLNESSVLRNKIISSFGEETYNSQGLNRAFLSQQVFNNPEALQKLNSIVHPAVFEDFEQWKEAQTGSYVVKEAAILIESGSYKTCDAVILVISEIQTRIERVMERDKSSKDLINQRISNQLSDEEKRKYADYILLNNSSLDTLREHTYHLAKQLNLRFGN